MAPAGAVRRASVEGVTRGNDNDRLDPEFVSPRLSTLLADGRQRELSAQEESELTREYARAYSRTVRVRAGLTPQITDDETAAAVVRLLR
jgi:hypothetical protein